MSWNSNCQRQFFVTTIVCYSEHHFIRALRREPERRNIQVISFLAFVNEWTFFNCWQFFKNCQFVIDEIVSVSCIIIEMKVILSTIMLCYSEQQFIRALRREPERRNIQVISFLAFFNEWKFLSIVDSFRKIAKLCQSVAW